MRPSDVVCRKENKGYGEEFPFFNRESRMPGCTCGAHLVQFTSHLGSHSCPMLPVLHIHRPRRQRPLVWNELDPGVELGIFLFCLRKCCKESQFYFEILLDVFFRGVMMLKMFHFFLACMRKRLPSNRMAVTASCMVSQLPVPNQLHTQTHAHTFTQAHKHRDIYEHTYRVIPPACLKI